MDSIFGWISGPDKTGKIWRIYIDDQPTRILIGGHANETDALAKAHDAIMHEDGEVTVRDAKGTYGPK